MAKYLVINNCSKYPQNQTSHYFGEEAKEEILKILSEKFVFYLMEPDEMPRKINK